MFMSVKQKIDEPIVKYLHRLRNVSRYCEFEKLGHEEQMIKEDLDSIKVNWRYLQCITPI